MLSVIIPAYNEEKRIAACLGSLARQETCERFEVILVDNDSTDSTVAIAKRYEGALNLRIVFESERRRGSARQRGFAEAKGDILFSTDADSRPKADWIESFMRVFRAEPDTVAVTSLPWIDDCHPLVNGTVNGSYFLFLQCYRAFKDHWLLPGFNFAVRASAYRKTQGFRTGADLGEDAELSELVSRTGTIRFVRHTMPVSGRRFQNGLIKGTWSYVKPNVEKVLGKKDAVLSNVR